jgi:hypothetical protein
MGQKDRVFIPRPDRRLGDRYELLECLGDGSYGWVWRATRLADGQTVAVKIPKAQGACNEDLAEGEALVGQPPHPNVVNVHWMGRVPPEREWYAIEMEYFPGVTLSQLLDRAGEGYVTTYEEVLGLYGQVLQGVRHLHDLGMCHGDIKPQNILVSGGAAKLTDFGSSIRSEEMYARVRENGGTILYSAPEVVGSWVPPGEFEVLRKADIYSLGVLLYHLLTARLPHDTYSQVARHCPFPRPREINGSVSPALEEFTLRCLAQDPAGRWASVQEMIPVFEMARQGQRGFLDLRPVAPHLATEDWSSRAVRCLEAGGYREAEHLAAHEYGRSEDPHAFLLMLAAASRDGRHYDCLHMIDEHPELLAEGGPATADVRSLALKSCLETRQLDRAERLVEECLGDRPEDPGLLLKKASVLGAQARYQEAVDILLGLNREHPRRPPILKRLVLAFEQLRDMGKAAAFLRAFLRERPDDDWGREKLKQFTTLGVA